MRRLSVLAVAIVAIGCSSHSVAPVPAEMTSVTPQVLQKQPLSGGAWTSVVIPRINGHPVFPDELTVDAHANIWVADGDYPFVDAVSKVTMGQNVTNYPTSFRPSDIVAGPDGNMWVTSYDSGVVARISPSGLETDYNVATGSGVSTMSITTGPDGALWFTLEGDAPFGIGRITTAGKSTLYTAVSGADGPIVTGPDGNLWLGLNHDAPNVYKVTPQGTLAGSYVIPGGGLVIQLAPGPDGAMWIAAGPVIGRITTSGSISTFVIPGPPGPNSAVTGIATGLDGNLWTVCALQGALDLISFDPTSHTFGNPIPSPFGIFKLLLGPDKNFWFTDGKRLSTYVNLVMTVAPATLTIPAPGQSKTLTVSETNYSKRWSATSTNPAVATVPSGGTRKPIVVTGVGVGSCTIIISDRDYNRVRVKVTVQ